MDWYFGSIIEDLVVPKDEEISDRFPSPENWSKWGINESETFGFPNKGFVIYSKLNQEELNFNCEILSNNEVEMESSAHDDKDQSSSSIGGGISSEESIHHQTALSCDQQLDYQLDGLAGFQQMDDLFLSSLMEDPLGTENIHSSFCFEPELQNYMVRDDNISTDTMLDTQSISSEAYSMGSSKYLKTHVFSPSVDQEKCKVSALPFTPSNAERKNRPSLKEPLIKVLAPSEHKNMNEHEDEETSLEESVLQELEMVMAQLTEKTRICFRDAFYRLAKNSRQHVVTHNQNGNLSMGTTAWTGQEEKIRPGGKKTMELETNTIDRAIANLMFNKMDLNVRDFPVSALASSRMESLKATRSSIYSSNQQQIHDFPHGPNFSSDTQVPILCPGYLQTRAIPDVYISRNPAEEKM
ncbi:hypothetical protein P3X46_001722 [Hevea brasiliensis]|uniref:Protein LNK3 n=1 Tax=Hevea brasiliensis TaxID=3981 RepID=A0ABQ9NDD0_HEVBR|nr:protein LNK3 [Hevea brasiliensis]KAJ9190534.1 hypothetical protein P3X46_001722 [Hevea brasiliensis]